MVFSLFFLISYYFSFIAKSLLMMLSYIFIFLNFYWSIVALQYCIHFCCEAKWISYTYAYIPSFLDFLPVQVTRALVEFPVLSSRFWLVSYFIHSINIYVSPSFLIRPTLSPIPALVCYHLIFTFHMDDSWSFRKDY